MPLAPSVVLPGPARILLRMAAVAAAVVVTAAVHIPGRPPTLCVLRAVTGVPCPFCGGTTAAVHLGHGDLLGALSASPLALAMLALVPFWGIVAPPQWLRNAVTRRVLLGAVLAAAELWQLSRYGFLAFGGG